MATLDYPASKIGEQITMTVRVTGLTVFKARWWLAKWMMVAAARVAGCGLEVDVRGRQWFDGKEK